MRNVAQNICATVSILISAFLTFSKEPYITQTIIVSSLSFASIYAFLKYTRLYHPPPNNSNTNKDSTTKEIEAEWRSRMIGSIHAVIITIGSLLCFHESWIKPHNNLSLSDLWKLNEVTSSVNDAMCTVQFAAIFVGYLQYDLWWLLTHPNTKGKYDVSSIIHHILYIAVTHFTLSGIYFIRSFAWLSFAELSTPFLHVRWFYVILKKKESAGYLISSILFAVTFLFTRVLGYTLGLIDLWSAYPIWSSIKSSSGQEFNELGFYLVVIALHMGYMLNLFWSVKVVKALGRALMPYVRLTRKQNKID